jgi:hypothetical protein
MRVAVRLTLAIALLLAQHVSLAHQVWHAGRGDSHPAQGQLCEQHAALATVAGALDSAPIDAPGVARANFSHVFSARPGATAPALSPVSRGPPGTAATLN